MSAVRIGFIGAGKMATALARGIVSQGQILSRPQDLMASCPPQDANLLAPIKELGCTASHDNLEVISNSDIVILAVKPAIIPRILSEGKPLFQSKLVTSIAAGIKIRQMQDVIPEAKVIRVMPNTPSLVQEGATVYSKGQNCQKEDGFLVEKIFRAVGPSCHEVPETWIDSVTGISGSGPAYMYIIIGKINQPRYILIFFVTGISLYF